jgi:hypothetical protein
MLGPYIVLSYTRHWLGRLSPLGRAAALLAGCPPLPLPQQWTCSAVQIATRVPLSLYLGPRLVNVVSLAYKLLTANHVLIMQQISPKGLGPHHTALDVGCPSFLCVVRGVVPWLVNAAKHGLFCLCDNSE